MQIKEKCIVKCSSYKRFLTDHFGKNASAFRSNSYTMAGIISVEKISAIENFPPTIPCKTPYRTNLKELLTPFHSACPPPPHWGAAAWYGVCAPYAAAYPAAAAYPG